jgi:hypothetical protein
MAARLLENQPPFSLDLLSSTVFGGGISGGPKTGLSSIKPNS